MKAILMRAGLLLLALMLLTLVARAAPGETLIVGDASGSMKGYAKAGASRLSALYQLLYRNASAPRLSALTSDLKTGTVRIAPVPQASYFAAQGSYRGGTDLIYALQYIEQQQGVGLLVTDGMQSGGMYMRVKEEMLRLVRDGWGMWLVAVKLPFDGFYDPEQAVDLEVLKPTIEQCARQNDPNATITFKPGSNRIYNYAGMKPLLLFILTKDIAAGRELAQRLDFNLKADPQYSSQVAELSPLFYRGVAFAPAQPVSDYIRLDEAADQIVIHSDTVDGLRIKEIALPVLWQAGEPPMHQPFVETPTYAPPGLVSWVEEEPQVTEDGTNPGRFRVLFVSEVSTLRRFFCWMPFVSCESVKEDALKIEIWTEFKETDSPWWAAFNTDNSYECPNRVYKLAELARDIAQAAKERLNPESRKVSKSLKLIVGPT